MVLKCALNNICNTVMSGQGPSSSGGPLRSGKKPGRDICYKLWFLYVNMLKYLECLLLCQAALSSCLTASSRSDLPDPHELHK